MPLFYGHPNFPQRSCHFSDRPCRIVFHIVCHTAHYSSSFYLLLHLATSADRRTAPRVLGPTLPLLKATWPPANSAISVSSNLGINTGIFSPPPHCALFIFPVHWVPFLRAILAKVGHNGRDAADSSPFGLCGGNEDRSQFLLLAPEAQKVTADSSSVLGLIWLSEHI